MLLLLLLLLQLEVVATMTLLETITKAAATTMALSVTWIDAYSKETTQETESNCHGDKRYGSGVRFGGGVRIRFRRRVGGRSSERGTSVA